MKVVFGYESNDMLSRSHLRIIIFARPALYYAVSADRLSSIPTECGDTDQVPTESPRSGHRLIIILCTTSPTPSEEHTPR